MWSSYVKPVIWSSFVPCSTYYSTSEVANSLSTFYETVAVTSSSWTTWTSYTTVFTTITETSHTTQTHTTDDTSWTTATEMTTEPVLITEHYSTTDVVVTTKPVSSTLTLDTTETHLNIIPVSTYETVRTTLTGHETETDLETWTDLETIYTTQAVEQTHVISQTAWTTLTSHTTYETMETITTSHVIYNTPVVSPVPPPPPPPPPSSVGSSPSPVAVPPTVTAPPPPPPPNPCTQPPYNDFFQVSWFGWRPNPSAEPLVTLYRTVDIASNITITNTFCNTQAFENDYRTNLFDCARCCGPYQTLNSDCEIVIGPVFTGSICGQGGRKITLSGSSGNIIDLDTSIVGHGLTVDGTCIPVTTTTLQTPFIYSGDVRSVDSFETALARRAAPSGQKVIASDITSSTFIDPFNTPNANLNFADNGANTGLVAGKTFIPEATTVSGVLSPSGDGAAQAVNQAAPPPTGPQSPTQGPPEETVPPSPPPSSPTEAANTQAPATPTSTPPDETPSSTNGTPRSPIRPTSESATVPTGMQGSMSIVPGGEPSFAATTCVPLSMVIPSSEQSGSNAPQALSSTAASASAPLQQTGNIAPRLGTSMPWLAGSLCVMLGLLVIL